MVLRLMLALVLFLVFVMSRVEYPIEEALVVLLWMRFCTPFRSVFQTVRLGKA